MSSKPGLYMFISFLTLSVTSNGRAFNELCIGKVIGHGKGPLRCCSIIYLEGLRNIVQYCEDSLPRSSRTLGYLCQKRCSFLLPRGGCHGNSVEQHGVLWA
jgi:hypothetical protein